MLSIVEKVKDLFKCKAEKKEESAPQQEEPQGEGSTEEPASSFEGTDSD